MKLIKIIAVLAAIMLPVFIAPTAHGQPTRDSGNQGFGDTGGTAR